MAKYYEGDLVTFYFVIKHMNGDKVIQAWSDNKDLVKMYMDFHKCKNFKVKSVSNTIEEINKICEENYHDEIQLFNINTRDPKRKGRVMGVSIPATRTEIEFINEETSSFLSSHISYTNLEKLMPYLKKKDQEALHNILLEDITKKVLYEERSRIIQSIQIDQLVLFYKIFPENFGI